MQKQNGFTLIELVVVIIILGILAVTAAPKFINLQSDARASTLQGLKGSMQGANSLVFSKAAIAGKEKLGDTTVQIGAAPADTVKTAYGYLQNDKQSILDALDISEDDWTFVVGADQTKPTVIYQAGSPYDASVSPVVDCHFEYTPAQSSSISPKYEVKDTGC
ncbi:type II secretion system GspH family protein [Shewanella schlegeliana]|uniref:Type II secretion system protein n=1 Tax=Shewanella schlegeliana TaxID=190308 RepID=A0ABS1SYQ4_9GAMM|nr:type II secretion system protein [Shewanella schlegeliana]MBL4913009.1 type II secretion system protein [Shewanella schlegeliana]MCL1108895.1 type II secretion system GspH family protein [Shewanella schlegeliana]GIU23790.1 MSHA pilin protein MshA [Shewanella schlegeliana]